MDSPRAQEEPQSIGRESRAIWDANAEYWDTYMGDSGNAFHLELVSPSAERLLALEPGETVLEIACGSGLFSRRMAELGATVVATDFSAAMLDRARARSLTDRIEYRSVDATDAEQLAGLGENRFDAAICNMALMDISEIDPLFTTLPRLLKPSGRFVFTVCHPCFNTTGCVRMAEQIDTNGVLQTVYSIKVSRYKRLTATMGVGIPGQPHPQYYFDRTLSDLLNAAFRAGWRMDGIEEPAFSTVPEHVDHLSTRHFTEIPLVLAARLRPSGLNP